MPRTNRTAPAAEWQIVPRLKAWQALRRKRNLDLDADLAIVLDTTRQTVYRVLTGATNPSPAFIAAALVNFPDHSFDTLFTARRTRRQAVA